MCYGKEFENQLPNELGYDDEQSMRKKELKDEIDEFEEKIRALTEKKEKYEQEYNRLCNLKKYRNVFKENSNKFQEFKILIGCRKKEGDNEHWTNILIDESASNKISIQYPLSVDFNREFRELVCKYLNNSDEGMIIIWPQKKQKNVFCGKKIPSIITDDIEFAINQGDLEVVCYLPSKVSSDIIKDICDMLKELGYTVSDNNNVLRISWDWYVEIR